MSKKPNRVVQYKIANEKFLEQKAQEEGIKALESGILIREIEKGSGTRMPQLHSTVYVHYTFLLRNSRNVWYLMLFITIRIVVFVSIVEFPIFHMLIFLQKYF